ncbi:MAG: hypothetical protein ACLRL4_09265 [Bifidobacterium bifidum]
MNYQEAHQRLRRTSRTPDDDGFPSSIEEAILDAVDEEADSALTRLARQSSRASRHAQRKRKYLNQFELHAVLARSRTRQGTKKLGLADTVGGENAGLRFSEALGLTPDDFDFVHQTLCGR